MDYCLQSIIKWVSDIFHTTNYSTESLDDVVYMLVIINYHSQVGVVVNPYNESIINFQVECFNLFFLSVEQNTLYFSMHKIFRDSTFRTVLQKFGSIYTNIGNEMKMFGNIFLDISTICEFWPLFFPSLTTFE